MICAGAGTFDPALLLKLRKVREAEGMTLEEVAALLHVSRESICRVERGQSLAPRRRRQRHRREPAELLARYLELCRRTGGEMWWPDRGEG